MWGRTNNLLESPETGSFMPRTKDFVLPPKCPLSCENRQNKLDRGGNPEHLFFNKNLEFSFCF